MAIAIVNVSGVGHLSFSLLDSNFDSILAEMRSAYSMFIVICTRQDIKR